MFWQHTYVMTVSTEISYFLLILHFTQTKKRQKSELRSQSERFSHGESYSKSERFSLRQK